MSHLVCYTVALRIEASHPLRETVSIGASFCFLVNFLQSDNFSQKSNKIEWHSSQIIGVFRGFSRNPSFPETLSSLQPVVNQTY